MAPADSFLVTFRGHQELTLLRLWLRGEAQLVRLLSSTYLQAESEENPESSPIC